MPSSTEFLAHRIRNRKVLCARCALAIPLTGGQPSPPISQGGEEWNQGA